MHDHGSVGLPLGFTLLRLLLLGSVTLVAAWSLLRAAVPAEPGQRARRAAAGAAALGGIAALLAADARWMPDRAAVAVIALLVLPTVLRGPRPVLGWCATAGVTAAALAVGVAATRAPAGGTAAGAPAAGGAGADVTGGSGRAVGDVAGAPGLAGGPGAAGGPGLAGGPAPAAGSDLAGGPDLAASPDLAGGSPLDALVAGPPSTAPYLALIAAFAGASWLALCPPTRAARVVGGVFGAVLLAALGHVTASGWLVSPPAGDPLLARAELGGARVDVLVVPHMPGWNLVQTSGAATSVGNAPAALTPTSPVAGQGGRWALVWLPEGRGELWLAGAGARTTVVVDTGTTAWTGRDVRGPDGPDYASAVLAARLAGGRGDLPLPELSAEDARALRAEVAAVGGPLAVRADASPRSAEAAEVVRAEADRLGVPVDPAAPRALVLGGEPTGDHLAPWLAPPDLSTPTARRYATVLAEAFPDARPTTSGLRAWLATT
ncbi:DUF6239 family natural product biosynthesis protein [Actinosynnema pretiosum]|uniref:Uncharacterized protein n=2 Tax=Actinosynnema TaxID=40566 RepID=A0A290Z8M0_9PSEU|nr:DUF6239 family natural product biosynthesis protein [Actinosynnema pretiosum]ATE55391.1 hypothetical protein CNX65_20635 [Actinosynnema pretiosum]